MAFLVRGTTGSTALNPVLDVFTYVMGTLTDAASVKFRIFDLTTPANKTEYYSGNKNNVQIFPVTPGLYFPLDVVHLSTDLGTPGHKIGTGHFYAPWAVPPAATLGNYIVEWVYKQTLNGPDQQFTEEFVVISDGQVVVNSTNIEILKMMLQD